MDPKISPKRKKFLPSLLSTCGTVMFILVILLVLPTSLPRFIGWEPYEIVSGSMEPTIPVGSLVYVRYDDPASIQKGDVIAFMSGNSVVCHRVTENKTSEKALVTKGDANAIEDFEDVAYPSVLGTVVFHLPFIGGFLSVFASLSGKIYLVLFILCGILLHILAGRLRS